MIDTSKLCTDIPYCLVDLIKLWSKFPIAFKIGWIVGFFPFTLTFGPFLIGMVLEGIKYRYSLFEFRQKRAV